MINYITSLFLKVPSQDGASGSSKSEKKVKRVTLEEKVESYKDQILLNQLILKNRYEMELYLRKSILS
ncbi:hypothetical protein EAX61_09775 [Dokdonia sinensis]|uniref:Uncharacterized protein n=1 Tax=Dokdonia sinensis TaxID=2479847 RepID=A0A3M0GBY4_9FLAO|nr:hypothetical protein EAX61_09775 [Dokdonia sinensis]